MNLIDGKAISEQIKQEIAAEVAERVARGEKRPHLAAILVGHDGGSETYVANKVKACEACGFTSSLIRFESDVTEDTLLAEIDRLNKDAEVLNHFVLSRKVIKRQRTQRLIQITLSLSLRIMYIKFHIIN